MKKYPLQEYVSDALLTWLFSFSLLWMAFQSLQYDFSALLAALYLIGFTLAWILILRFKWVAIIVGALLFLVVLYWELTMPSDYERTQALLEDWNQYVLWLGSAVSHNIPAPPDYLDRSLLLMCSGSSLLTGVLVRVKTHPVVFLSLGGGLFFVQEFYMDTLFFPAFFLYLCALALYTLRQSHMKRRNRAQKTVPPARALAGALPLCLLAVGLSLLLPSSDTALGQPILNWFGTDSSETSQPLNLSSFSYGGLKKRDDNDILGGPLRQNHTPLLSIRADQPSYLRAHAYDLYSGRSWRSSNGRHESFGPPSRFAGEVDFANEISVDLNLPFFYPFPGPLVGGYQPLLGALLRANLETARGKILQSPVLDKLFDIEYDHSYPMFFGEFFLWTDGDQEASIYAPEGVGEFIELRRLSAKPNAVFARTQRITFLNMRGNTLFLPQGAVNLSAGLPPEGADLSEFTAYELGDIKTRRTMNSGFMYWADTFELNLTKQELGDLLRLSGQDMLDSIKNEYTISGEVTISNGILTSIRNFEEWKQEQIRLSPVLDLPESLPRRVYDLAHDLTDGQPTDYDKALAIETYLRGNFPYDTEVPETPEGRDFVDYFLFDLRRGYCTYYATAMTVLCRAADLPARYVEGFVPVADKNKPGQYLVTGEEAHAWCEVYFTGFGWVTFDPTASLGTEFETKTQVRNTPAPQTPIPTPEQPASTPSPAAPSATPEPETTEGWIPPLWLCILLPTATALLVLSSLHSFRRGRFLRSRRDPRRAAVILFRRTVLLAFLRGASKPKSSETPLEWARRVDGTLGVRTGVSLLPSARLYGRLLYGPGKATPSDAAELYRLYNVLVQRWKMGINPVIYFVYKHVFGLL